jgi:hypothetical protein
METIAQLKPIAWLGFDGDGHFGAGVRAAVVTLSRLFDQVEVQHRHGPLVLKLVLVRNFFLPFVLQLALEGDFSLEVGEGREGLGGDNY